jgi:uncharacterized membrane protein YfcA
VIWDAFSLTSRPLYSICATFGQGIVGLFSFSACTYLLGELCAQGSNGLNGTGTMEFVNLLIIFVVAAIAGSFGTLVGGSSLITIPTLIFLGLPPHTAIGSDRLGVTGIASAGWYEFHKKDMVNYRIGFIISVPTVLGSILGANLVFQFNETILKKAIAIITIVILVLMVGFRPTIGIQKADHTLKSHEYLIGVVISFFVGIYAGFYGAGAGTLISYILLLVFKQTFLECAGTLKMPGLFFTAIAASIFAIHGAIDYPMALSMFVGGFTGSYLAAHYSDRIGNIWIKRLFLAAVLVMAVKLLL